MKAHLAKESDMTPGSEIYLKGDHTLTHDINAVMTYLAFEAIGLDRTQVEFSVSNLDHNLLTWTSRHLMIIFTFSQLQNDTAFMSQDLAAEFVTLYTWHALENLGKLSMGGDSHTPHGGDIGMDVATAMT